jgi:hypothetical protein
MKGTDNFLSGWLYQSCPFISSPTAARICKRLAYCAGIRRGGGTQYLSVSLNRGHSVTEWIFNGSGLENTGKLCKKWATAANREWMNETERKAFESTKSEPQSFNRRMGNDSHS